MVIVGAVAAAAVAIWLTLRAGFLAYPGWLAAQKADFILGPTLVGLYWRFRRPNNRLGLLLIALGLAGVPYILESATNPVLFGVGVASEVPIYVMATAVILAFPSGRVEGWAARLILILAGASGAVVFVLQFTIPDLPPGGSISGCRAACPRNGLAVWSPLPWTEQLFDIVKVLLLVIPLAIAALLVWRFVTGTPPRRRALAVGGPIALLFVLIQATYRIVLYVNPGFALSQETPKNSFQWGIAVGRSLLWYGFFFALIAAELYAGRVLRRQVRQSLEHPSLRELEPLLREPLGDPSLRLGFWHADLDYWADVDGKPLEPPLPSQTLTEIERDGPAAAIVHDRQLSDDPELLQAAGAVALLALEHAELESAWQGSLRALSAAHETVLQAGATERRRLERDLHDGVQQQLVAASITLSLLDDLADGNPALREGLGDARDQIEDALVELREIAHGIYPRTLSRSGLRGAFAQLAARTPDRVSVEELSVGRFAPGFEALVYYLGREAVQNALKHAGPDANVSIRLHNEADWLRLEVRDNGAGFSVAGTGEGVGVQNIRDRVSAAGGELEIVSTPGRGTLVAAVIPVPPVDSVTADDRSLALPAFDAGDSSRASEREHVPDTA